MDHLSLRGAHWEMGFQWGARLAERGRFLLDHVPFSLTAERRAFAASDGCRRDSRARDGSFLFAARPRARRSFILRQRFG